MRENNHNKTTRHASTSPPQRSGIRHGGDAYGGLAGRLLVPAVGPGPGFGAVLQPLPGGRQVHEGLGGRRAGMRAGGGLSILCGSGTSLPGCRQLQLRETWRRARSPPVGRGERAAAALLTAGRDCASAVQRSWDGSCCHADGAARSPRDAGGGRDARGPLQRCPQSRRRRLPDPDVLP